MYTLTNNSSAAFAGGVFGSMIVTFAIVGLIMFVLMVIAGWKIFEKAGEEGWKSIIPIYNSYIFFKIVGMTKCFWGVLIASFLFGLIPTLFVGVQDPTTGAAAGIGALVGFLSFALGVCALIISIVYAIRMSKAFGHGVGFTLGLIFLSNIFLLILGFDKSKYNQKLVKSWKQI